MPALAHAGIAESSVAQLEIEFDSEDGLMVYEVEFYAGGTEYDYDINARTGEVVNFSREGGISGGTTGQLRLLHRRGGRHCRRPDPRRRQRSGHHLSPAAGWSTTTVGRSATRWSSWRAPRSISMRSTSIPAPC